MRAVLALALTGCLATPPFTARDASTSDGVDPADAAVDGGCRLGPWSQPVPLTLATGDTGEFLSPWLSIDGQTLVFQQGTKLYQVAREGTGWGVPFLVLTFSSTLEYETFLSADLLTAYYDVNGEIREVQRPVPGAMFTGSETKVMTLTSGPINLTEDGTLTSDGTRMIYSARNSAASYVTNDLYLATRVPNTSAFTAVQRLPDVINDERYDCCASVAGPANAETLVWQQELATGRVRVMEATWNGVGVDDAAFSSVQAVSPLGGNDSYGMPALSGDAQLMIATHGSPGSRTLVALERSCQ